uniref:Beta-hexosaminidase n=1 Tax=Hirondellea gigas TaxID=1518452 RepID=A0A2P2I9J4_9CRUS
MHRVAVLLLCLVGAVIGEGEKGIPYVTPSEGRVWPKPQMEVTEQTYLIVRPATFKFRIVGKTCDLLEKALSRYMDIMFSARTKSPAAGYSKTKMFRGYLDTVDVHLMAECEKQPYLHMDEHYQIKVDSPDRPLEGSIIAASVWGAFRGLESFSHLLVADGGSYRVNSTQIMDHPRFPHRGLMIDSSRHFLPLSSIKQTLDLMSMDKFNVLHWHIVDSQSFPYQSDVYPDLSGLGSWTSRHIYTSEDVATVVSYALERGIRVMPEFDTPGHTDSWGPGQPGLLTECYKHGKPDGTYGPVDPSNEDNYDFLKKLFTEVTQRFPDHYLHLGGDEVSFRCWRSNPELSEFMQHLNITGDYAALEQYYITKLLELVGDLPTKNGYLVWQEVFDNGVELANDTVVHIWKDGGDMDRVNQELADVTASGFQTLLSSCWYLNVISYGVDWHKYYSCDPQGFNGTDAQKALIVGGEACMWGEYVDRTNLISRTWPRASVVAEKLWSAADATTNPDEATPRLEEHRCRLLGRGYGVEPFGPSYCDADIV